MLLSMVRSLRTRRPSPTRRPLRPRLEALEGRLVLSWGGVPPTPISPPTDAVALSLNSQGDATGNAAITANEIDYYSLDTPTTGAYRISATTPASGLDTVLGVFSSNGTRIASNDDSSSSNRDSQLSVTLTAGNRYFVGVTNYRGTPGGSYTWGVDGPASGTLADDTFEENDSLAGASGLGRLTAQQNVTGLVMADAADWFSFTTAATGTSTDSVTISFQNSQGDLDLALYNSGGELLVSSTTTSNVETVSLRDLASGTYYVRVSGSQGATNPSYSLNVTPPPAGPGTPGTGSYDIDIRASGLTPSQQSIFDQAATRWEQIIVGDLPAATYEGVAVDDLLIDASSVTIDGAGGILGQAGPDYVRGDSVLPIHGSMQFDTADLASMESNGTLYEVILHEMGHVLGIGSIWQTIGLLTGAGTANPQFAGPQATAEYNALFGTSEAGVPVEGTPAPEGTRDVHWRESVFDNELMSGYIASSGNPISRVTVASLADIGYTVNMAAADPYAPPSSSGIASDAAGGSATSLVAADPSVRSSVPTRRPTSARRATA